MDYLIAAVTEYLQYLQKHPITKFQDRIVSRKLVLSVFNGDQQYFFTVECLLLFTEFQGAELD